MSSYQLLVVSKKRQYARERYQNKKEKNKKKEYGHEQYKDLSETEKQRLVKYRKRYEM